MALRTGPTWIQVSKPSASPTQQSVAKRGASRSTMDQALVHCRYIWVSPAVVLAMSVALLARDMVLNKATSQPTKGHHHTAYLRHASCTTVSMATINLVTCAPISTDTTFATNKVTLGAIALTNRRLTELSEFMGTDKQLIFVISCMPLLSIINLHHHHLLHTYTPTHTHTHTNTHTKCDSPPWPVQISTTAAGIGQVQASWSYMQ